MKKTTLSLSIVVLMLLLPFLTNHNYLYKAIKLTYLKGNNSASINDYKNFANRKVKAGNHIPWNQSQDYNKIDLSPVLDSTLIETNSIAFLVIKNDSIIQESYWDGYNQDSYSNSFSMSKSIISTLVGIAIQEGLFQTVFDQVNSYLPNYNSGFDNSLTIKHLLTMSAELNWTESYSNPFASTAKTYYGNNIYKKMINTHVLNDPSNIFQYQSGATQLLAMLLEKVTGGSISEYASEKLWNPIGAKNDALWMLDKVDGNEIAYCCFNSNARDFARLGKLYLNQGRFDSIQVVHPDYIRVATSVKEMVDLENKPVNYYGYQWWLINRNGMDMYYARGLFGQYLIVIPEKDIIIVRLGHKNGIEEEPHRPSMLVYIDETLKTFK